MNSAQQASIQKMVSDAVADTKITDIHTHTYPASFGSIMLWGVDELLTYHYLIAETTRWINMPYDDFLNMPKREQADLIWQTLFIDHAPISEACRGVLTVLNELGLDTSSRDLNSYRAFFVKQKAEDYVDRVFELAGVDSLVMTNDPFDDDERPMWLSGAQTDSRFHAALRIDMLFNSWGKAASVLRSWGYKCEEGLGGQTIDEVRRFLSDWIERLNAVYMAVSLPYNFDFPEDSTRGRLIEQAVLPVAREKNIPFALMIGVKRAVNPGLKLAGDSVGLGSLAAVERLCVDYPDNKFLVTMLSLENQHELCVTARKFRNLMIFGCWWFLNNPSLIERITRMRFELLGLSVIPQHSDARVLDQLIYKWRHSRKIIAEVLGDKYIDLANTGWKVSEKEIQRDISDLLGGNFWSFVNK